MVGSRWTRARFRGWPLLAIGLLIAVRASGQSAVVVTCIDKSGTAKDADAPLRSALEKRGVKLIPYQEYLMRAKRQGLNRTALKPQAVQKLSKSLGLAGIVTCTVRKVPTGFEFAFSLLDTLGKTRFTRTLSSGEPKPTGPDLEALADEIAKQFPKKSPEEDSAFIPLVDLSAQTAEEKKPEEGEAPTREKPAKPTEAEKPTEATKPQTEEEKQFQAILDASQRTDSESASKEDLARLAPPDKVDEEREEVVPPPPMPVAKAHIVKKKTKPEELTGPVADIFAAIGGSLHLREGLSPRMETGFYPGLRIEARAFLSAFLDKPVLRDFGLAGVYYRVFGLAYTSELHSEKLYAYEQHWRAELVYRLAFEKTLFGPTVLFRAGFGATDHPIDRKFKDVLSAKYSYGYSAVEGHVWIVRSLVSLYLTGGYLWMVWPSDSLDGSGQGVTFGGGVQAEILETMHLSLGYEQFQFLIDDNVLGDTSDRFGSIFLRFGLLIR